MITAFSSNSRHSLGFMIIRSTRTRQGTTCSLCRSLARVFSAAALMNLGRVVQRLTILVKTWRISKSWMTSRTGMGLMSRCFASLATASAHAMSCSRTLVGPCSPWSCLLPRREPFLFRYPFLAVPNLPRPAVGGLENQADPVLDEAAPCW